MTEVERRLWVHLRGHRFHGFGFCRQVPIGPYIADFVCHEARLVIELDGAQHGEADAMAFDTRRSALLAEEGYRVVRFWNREIVDTLEGVLHRIAAALGRADPDWLDRVPPSPTLPHEGRGREPDQKPRGAARTVSGAGRKD